MIKAIILSAIVAYYGECEGEGVNPCPGGRCPGLPTERQRYHMAHLGENFERSRGGMDSFAARGMDDMDGMEYKAQSNSRDSVASAMEVETSNGAEGWSFDIESASIGFALGAVLVLLAVFAVNVVKRKKTEKSDEIAMVSQQREDKAQESPANVVTVVETVVGTEME